MPLQRRPPLDRGAWSRDHRSPKKQNPQVAEFLVDRPVATGLHAVQVGPFRPRHRLTWHAMAGPDPDVASAATATAVLEPLMSIDEVASVLRISHRGVYRLIERGEIPTLKVGHRTLVEPAEVRAFIANQRQPVDPRKSERAA